MRNAPESAPPAIPVVPVRDTVHFPGVSSTLHVARDISLAAVRRSLEGDRLVLVVAQRDMNLDEPTVDDLYAFGTLSEVLQSVPLPDTSMRTALRGLARARVKRMFAQQGALWAEVETVEDTGEEGIETEAMVRSCQRLFGEVVTLNKEIPPEALDGVIPIERPGPLADAIVNHLAIRPAEKQRILEAIDVTQRLEATLALLSHENEVLRAKADIERRVAKELGQSQREFLLREQMRIIQQELGDRMPASEGADLAERLAKTTMPAEIRQAAERELLRLERAPTASPEATVSRNVLEVMLRVPWAIRSRDNLDLDHAAAVLNDRHHGLDPVKQRLLDFLAVAKLRGTAKGSVLCFVGPPGVGKTSVGRSIAESLDRKFARIALGGIRDEAEIRGHRRTYVGSMPGRIVQAVVDSGTLNPVIVLDELDKTADHGHGDPANALLEALDPEQNDRFIDHYLELPIDLSEVLFIATANVLEGIPSALRDRMELIEFPSYTEDERFEIARRHLMPRALTDHGLTPATLEVSDEAFRVLVQDYTPEPGVRELRRQIEALCRKAARRLGEGAKRLCVDASDLEPILGRARYRQEAQSRHPELGTSHAMVVSAVGGDVLPIEVALLPGSADGTRLKLTGNLGDVFRESAQTALTAIRLDERSRNLENKELHLHVPQAAVPKDGPSAGLPMALAIASLMLHRPVRGDTAMTGEITLRGRLLPIGGVREKVLAAERHGFKRVLLPAGNADDLTDLPAATRSRLEIFTLESLEEAVEKGLQ